MKAHLLAWIIDKVLSFAYWRDCVSDRLMSRRNKSNS